MMTAVVTFEAKIVRMRAQGSKCIDGPMIRYEVSVPDRQHPTDTYAAAFARLSDELDAYLAAPGHFTIKRYRGGMSVA